MHKPKLTVLVTTLALTACAAPAGDDVDVDVAAAESSPENFGVALPDFRVYAPRGDASCVDYSQGYPIKLRYSFVVANGGNAGATVREISVVGVGPSPNVQGFSTTVPNVYLGIGESKLVHVYLPALYPTHYTVTVTADSTNVTTEWNEANNQLVTDQFFWTGLPGDSACE